MPQQEALQVLARLAEDPHGRGPRPDKIAHRLVRRIRHPDGGQFAGPMQLRQCHRITPVGLHPVARFARDQGRRHDHAGMTKPLELPLQAVAAWSRLVTEAQLLPGLANRAASFAITSARFGNIPSCRTSPPRMPSATATAIVALWTSNPINAMLLIRPAPHA